MFKDTLKVFNISKNSENSSVDIVGGKIFINGVEVENKENMKIEIRIEAGATVKKIQSDQGLVVHGDIHGQVISSSVNCNDVSGDITAKNVNCSDVHGNIKAEGSVNCDKVTGNVTAKIVNS